MLQPKEIIDRALRDFKNLSGIKWYYLCLGVLLMAVLTPWFPTRKHWGDTSIFEDAGQMFLDFGWGAVLLMAIIIALISLIVSLSYHDERYVAFLKEFFKKDYPDWPEDKAEEKGYKIAKLYKSTFRTINWYGFLGQIVITFLSIEVFQLLAWCFSLSAFLSGIILIALVFLDINIFRYYKKAVARVVYDKHKDEVAAAKTESKQESMERAMTEMKDLMYRDPW